MYEKSSNGLSKHLDFVLLDFLCLHISLLLAVLIRHSSDFFNHVTMYKNAAAIITISFIFVVTFFPGYKNILKRGYYIEFANVLKQTFLVAMFFILILYILQKSKESSRIVFFLTFTIYLLFSYFMHILQKIALKKKAALNRGKRSLIIVCLKRNAKEFLSHIKQANYGISIKGLVIADKDMTGKIILDVPVVASAETAVEYMRLNWVDEIFIGKAADDLLNDFSTQLKNACHKMGITVHTMLLSLENDQQQAITERFAGFLVLSQSISIVSRREMILKRLMDIAGGIVGCILTLILFVLVAPFIFIASPGPIFFSQQRVGKNGKIFKIYKFRSMYMDAEKRKQELMAQNKVEDGMMFKMDNDPRIIKGIGHIIRDFSIDEFPQFFNVLKGDMSLVGTRPPTLDEWEKYELHHRKRLAIKPGITGMWQVCGRSNITDFEEIVKLDTQYIDEWSLDLDIKILFKTIAVVLTREGSQ